MIGELYLINLTQHEVTVVAADDAPILSLAPSGRFARLSESVIDSETMMIGEAAIPTSILEYGREVIDLPDPRPGVRYVVSRLTALAIDRSDVFFPQDEVRDSNGRIIGCRRLGRVRRVDGPPELDFRRQNRDSATGSGEDEHADRDPA